MTVKHKQCLEEKIELAIKEKKKRYALYDAMKRGRDSRNAAVPLLPGGKSFFKEVRSIKLRCQEQQEELVQKFAEKVRSRGSSVFMAQDGPEAIQYVLKIVESCGAKVVAKSKSLTSEEIGVNRPLEEAGIDVIETDLGELIIQKVDEKPFHLVFPAVHKTAGEVAEIFRKVTGEEVPEDIDGIMKIVRRYLRPIFLDADIGMTGANVGIAETGAIVIETNEGNARLVSSIPDVHICIMGREKIVDSIEDALQMMLAHPISAVGQHLTTYVTLMAGRSPMGEDDGRAGRESHIIILDNGRTRMAKDPIFKDALNCIRCGACMNICPTYGIVGGHTFGYIYPGPIGIPWTASVHDLEKAGDFASLCISCGLCQDICPAEIDIPMMIAAVKERYSKTHPQPRVNKVMMASEGFAKMGSAMAPVSNWFLRNRTFRWTLEKLLGVDRRREMPPFKRNTLIRQFKRRGPCKTSDPTRKVAFFADLYANYNAPELGLAAIEFLEGMGCRVILPKQKGCGYPYIGYGDLERAREAALFNVRSLLPYAEQGYDIVATEPTAAFCLKSSYPGLLRDSSGAETVAGKVYEFFEYVALLDTLLPPGTLISSELKGRRFGFHIPCHQRSLGAGQGAMNFLKQRGAKVVLVETGTCCGMGGTFGLKKGMLGYELSQAIGEPLFKSFKDAGVDTIVTESSVCSIHLNEGTGFKVLHPLELVR